MTEHSAPVTENSGPNKRETDATETTLELLKQLIALSSGVLALSATFLEKFWSDRIELQALLALSWALLMVSTICGLQAISSMVQFLRHPDFAWSADALRKWARASKWCFVAGIASFAIFAFLAALTSTSAGTKVSP